jgi:hypothetical protein
MKSETKKKISPREKILIIAGGVGGFLLAYVPTSSLFTGVLAGAPSGIAGICIALILCKKLKLIPNQNGS